MKKTYCIEVDCANCANLMENAINKLPGVESATVNFMAQKLTLQLQPDTQEKALLKQIQKTCKTIEPDFELYI